MSMPGDRCLSPARDLGHADRLIQSWELQRAMDRLTYRVKRLLQFPHEQFVGLSCSFAGWPCLGSAHGQGLAHTPRPAQPAVTAVMHTGRAYRRAICMKDQGTAVDGLLPAVGGAVG